MRVRIIQIISSLFLSIVIFHSDSFSQSENVDFSIEDFALSGDAFFSGGNCIQLTDDSYWQGGAAWYKTPIDLSHSFSMELAVNFGCNEEGADGIVFILHPDLTTGFAGEGMGFGGLAPSFGIEMDSYENYHLSDPAIDHVAFMAHGMLDHHFSLSSPVPLKKGSTNVQDCANHQVNIGWNPQSKNVSFFFDGVLRVQQQVDLVNGIFNKNPKVYWGFTAATGKKYNPHSMCIKKMEFLEHFDLSTRDRELLLNSQGYAIKNLEFPAGSARLPNRVKPELDTLISFFQKHKSYSVIINGFTDSSGNKEANKRLSQLRAKVITDYLKENGISARRLIFYGLGEKNPIESNVTEAGRRKNRRVEIVMRVLKV